MGKVLDEGRALREKELVLETRVDSICKLLGVSTI